jgi:hypothetical protein
MVSIWDAGIHGLAFGWAQSLTIDFVFSLTEIIKQRFLFLITLSDLYHRLLSGNMLRLTQ